MKEEVKEGSRRMAHHSDHRVLDVGLVEQVRLNIAGYGHLGEFRVKVVCGQCVRDWIGERILIRSTREIASLNSETPAFGPTGGTLFRLRDVFLTRG